MSAFPWLPIGTALPGALQSGRLLDSGPAGSRPAWQVCAAGNGTVLLLQPSGGPPWWEDELERLRSAAGPALAETDGLLCLSCGRNARPMTLAGLALRTPPVDAVEAPPIVSAVLEMAGRHPGAGWGSALLLPGLPFALAVAEAQPGESRRAILLSALTGGAGAAAGTVDELLRLNGRLDRATARTVLDTLSGDAGVAAAPVPAPELFTLPGQPALEALLREQVLDVLHRPAEYARMGVPWPGGVLLAGPPGCGKSFAAARLASFLGWPLHEVSMAGVGSAFLHETSRQLARAFAEAASAAPAVVLLEELDALGRTRDGHFAPSVEEVNTLLREVEAAPRRRLLVLGTTNRPDAIDRALLRRGRFDLLHTMDYPDAPGAAAVLAARLADRPHAPGMDLLSAGRRLARRPPSDLAWVVDQAARLAVRGGRTVIDDILLARAMADLPPRAE